MKKKLLALLLAVMTVATIVPTMLLPTAAIDYYNGYETAMVSSGAINVDGSAIPDAAYLNSEKIVSTQHSNNLNSSGETSSFYGYTAADEMGLFLWVKITDQSLDKGEGYLVETIDPETYESFEEIKYLDAWQGDRLELYIKASGAQSNASRAVGVFGFDYLGQMMFRNPAFPLNYTNINGERLGFNTELVDFDTTVLEDESAWVAEMYLPWEALGGDFVNFTVDDFTGFQIGFMVTNATNSSNPSNKAYSYDTKHGGSYYRGTYASHAFSTGDASTGWRGSHCVPLSFAGFRTAVVNNAPAIDGYRDAAYLKSEVIDAYDACGGGKNFTAYTAATLEGYYVYVDVIDDTLDKLPTTTIDRGDKVQIYFQMGNRFSNRDWGYVEMDYRTAAECDSAVANAVPFRFVVKGAFADNAATPKAEDFRYATTRKADGSGWTAELFIPWAGRMKDNNFDELTGTTMVLAINVMNYTNEGSRITYCLSDAWAGSAWYANGGSSGDTSGNFYCAPVYFDFETEGAEKKIIRIANYSASDLVLDGEKDSAYSENAVDLVDNVYVQSYGATDELAAGWHYGDFVIAKAYYTATDTDAYVYVEVYDDTVAPSKTGDTLAVYFENSETIAKFNISPFEGGTFNGNTNYQGKAFAFPTSNAPFEVNDSIAFKLEGEDYNSYTGYAVEFRMPLPEAERAALAAGKAINIGIGVEVINTNSDGNRLWYGHSAIGGNLWWQTGNDILGHTAMPKVRLEKNTSGGGEEEHVHEWNTGEILVPPTCNGINEIIYTCIICGEKMTEILTSPPHDWDAGVITVLPTYTEYGEITYTCGKCGETRVELVPPLDPEDAPFVEIIASEIGEDNTLRLTVSLKNNPGLWALVFRLPINSEAFDFVGADTSGSVFTKFGICEYHETKGAYMFNGMSGSVFDTVDSDGTVVVITLKLKESAASGDYVFGALIDEKNTVDLDGKVKVESKSCTVNVIIDDQHICEFGDWQKYDGTYHVRYCECGKEEYEEHIWDNGTVTVQPTHLKEGERTYSCTCGASYTEVIEKLTGHTFGDWEEYDDGNHVRYCACGEEEYDVHKWSTGVVTTPPTHTTDGIRTYTCECGETKTEVVDKLPDHEWDDGVITTEPTYTTEGIRTYTCPCGATKTEIIPVIGQEKLPYVEISAGEMSADGTVQLTVSLKNNPGLWALVFRLPINSEAFDFVSADTSGSVFTKFGICEYHEIKGAYMFNGMSRSVFDTVDSDGTVVVITLKLKEGAASGDYVFGALIDEKNTVDLDGKVKVESKSCTVTVVDDQHICEFGDWQKYDGIYHIRYCECGKNEYGNHYWEYDEVIIREATHLVKGEVICTCMCGEAKHVYTDKLPEHEWDEGTEIVAPTYSTTGIMRYTCPCGAKRDEKIPQLVDVHVVMSATEAIIGDTVKITVSLKKNTGLWSLAFSLPVDTDVFEFVSADTSGSIFKRFGICNYDESTNEYKFNGLSSSDFNSVNATGTVVVITLKVKDDAVAGKYVLNALVDEINTVNINHESVKTESTPLTLSVTDHVCKFGAWEYYDKATHVRYCACGEEEYAEHTASRAVITHPTHTEFGYRTEYCECDSGRILKKVRLDKLPDHEWDNGKVTVQPTHLKEGERTYTCPCGDTYTDVIEKLPGHTFGEWSEFDSERHVHYCECGEAEYQKHSYTRSVTLQPTHLTEGEETYTCNCGYAYTKVMEKLSEHTFGEWSEFDSERHVHYCECGEAEYQKHSYKANVTLQPTHLTEGSATYTCPCGNTYTKVIEKLPDHTFGEWKEYDDENHAHYCACGEAEYEKHSHKATVTLHPTHLEEGEKTFKCACGASYTEVISPLPGHTFGAWKEHDEATHARYCECGETEYRAHVWGKGNITRYPTHLEEGERTYKCACGASYTEAISPLPDHTFGAWREYDDEVHVRYCECGETESEAHRWDNGTDTLEPTHITAGVRTFKCECNATCTEEIEPTPEHEWDDGEVTLQPTHLTEGEKTFNCPCGASYTEAIKKLPGHTFGAWEEYDDGNHVRYCACGEADYEEHNHKITDMVKPTHLTEGSETHTCHCGNTYTKVIKKISTHTFGEWSEFDSETHVRCCECGKTEYEAHAWDGGTITRQPTHLAEGEKTFNCPCGASYTEAIGKLLGHTFSKWSKYDDGNHYRYCACGETEYEAHIWNMVSVTRQPTHLEEGEKTIKCACGASYTEPIEKLLGHTFSKWIEVDGGNHYRYCACGETEYEAHAWNMVSVTRQPTHLTAGEKTIKCACGASYTEEIPTLPGHTFGNWNKYDEGNHYRYCECGETEYKPHSFDGGVVTTNPTHLKEGVKTYTCACKATYTETISPTPDHSWYGKVVTLPATHLTEGEWTYKCACGATYTEAIPPIPTHTYGEWIDFNAYNHVHYCECGAKELNAHVWDNGTVTLEPTYVAEGEMTQNCECGAVLKTAIPRIKESTETPKLIIDGGTTVAGNTVKITIKLENNPGIWSFAFSLPVDGEIFEFVSADTSGSIFKQFGICGYDESTNEYKFNGYNSSLSSNIASDGKLVTLTLKVKEGVATGEYKLAAALNERDIVDIDQNLIKFASVEGTVTVTDYVLGDVNGDGYVSNADVLCIFRYIYNSKLYPLTVVVADVNRDGFVTNADVLCIFRYIYNPNLYPIV